ncbi:MAG TPA: 3-methyladenine DNA glycosylase, partial [Dermatophilaceae bacterium]|nr:3-methyladenine DNA glycosylase [Dermatophilaceae bacterium]
DMRASPYDLSAMGIEPIAVETPEGKASYASEQRRYAARGQKLRMRLLSACASVLAERASID